MLSHLSSTEPLNGGNRGSWRKTIKIMLALWDINLTLMHDGESPEAFATRSQDFATLRMKYDLDRAGVVKL
jgi:hypothetical protein